MWQKLGMSAISGTVAHVFYLILAYVLDKFMNSKTSNIIALLASAILNFTLQYFVFMRNFVFMSNILIKYVISEVLIIGSVQLGVSFLLTNKKTYKRRFPASLQKYYNTLVRMFVTIIVSLLLSFPTRNYWVFV